MQIILMVPAPASTVETRFSSETRKAEFPNFCNSIISLKAPRARTFPNLSSKASGWQRPIRTSADAREGQFCLKEPQTILFSRSTITRRNQQRTRHPTSTPKTQIMGLNGSMNL
jgi:hypothetical protein